jgi:hypothetical protein
VARQKKLGPHAINICVTNERWKCPKLTRKIYRIPPNKDLCDAEVINAHPFVAPSGDLKADGLRPGKTTGKHDGLCRNRMDPTRLHFCQNWDQVFGSSDGRSKNTG